MNKNTYLLFILICFHAFYSYSQQPTIHNPETASINKFLDVPVDKSTGVPSIVIPIYDIKVNGFNMPLSISYHAGGIRVEEEASCVGLGWTLNAGGIISRSIKGQPDELGGYYSSWGTSQPQTTQIANPPYYPCNGCAMVLGEIPNVVEGGIDTEPDLFYFSVNGLSGKFIFDKTRRVRLIPDQGIIIEPLDQFFSGFKLINTDGTVYLFSAKESSYTISQTGIQSGNFTSGWRLTEIITPNLDSIFLNYSQQAYAMQKVVPQGVYLSRDMNCPESIPTIAYASATQQSLQSIVFQNGKIDFLYKSTFREDFGNCQSGSYGCINLMKALEKISIKETATGNLVKKIKFNTSYFISNSNLPYNTEEYLKKRLRLDEVYECDGAENCLPPYKFFYNKHNSTPNNYLPSRVSMGQDHWGYSNGADNNISLYTGIQNCSINADRNPNNNFKAAYVLDEISFPTGGITAFFYESSILGGGLRIKEIKNRPRDGITEASKLFTYEGDTYTAGGPVYVQSVESVSDIYNLTNGFPYMYNICNLFFNNAGVNHTFSFVFQRAVNYTGEITANYILYEKVTERTIGSGSIVSTYDVSHINDEIDMSEVGKYPFIVEAPLLLTGKLIDELVKNEEGQELVHVQYNYFSTRNLIIESADAYKVTKPLCKQDVKYYNIYSGAAFLESKNESILTPNGILESSTVYEYDVSYSHKYPKTETVSTSDGSVIRKRFKYPTDFKSEIGMVAASDSWDDDSRAIYEAILRNKINEPIEIVTTRIENGDEKVIGSKLLRFKTWVTDNNKRQLSLNSFSLLALGSPISYNSAFDSRVIRNGTNLSFVANEFYVVENEFQKYDTRNNVLSWKGKDGLSNVYVWGYNKSYPYVHIIGVDYSVVTGFVNQAILDNPLTTNDEISQHVQNLKNGLGGNVKALNSFTYKPLIGIVGNFDQNGRGEFYEYDNFNRLVLVRDFQNRIIKKICYNYSGQPIDCSSPVLFFNTPQSQTFTKNNCGTCSQGSQVLYTVAGNTYSSPVSVEAANQQALNDIATNGQSYANTNGTCTSQLLLTYNNQVYGTSGNGFTAVYTERTTGQVYSFPIPGFGSGSLGCIPTGSYNLTISKSGNNWQILFGSGCFNVSGTSATFGKVNPSTCNQISLQLDVE